VHPITGAGGYRAFCREGDDHGWGTERESGHQELAHALAKEDDDAREFHEAEQVPGMAFVACHQLSEALQPDEESLDLPSATVAPELMPALLVQASGAAVRASALDTARQQLGVALVAVLALVADQPRDPALEEAGRERGVNEGHLGGPRTCDTHGDRKTNTVCVALILVPFPLRLEPTAALPVSRSRRSAAEKS